MRGYESPSSDVGVCHCCPLPSTTASLLFMGVLVMSVVEATFIQCA